VQPALGDPAWAGGWAGGPTEGPANPHHSVILCHSVWKLARRAQIPENYEQVHLNLFWNDFQEYLLCCV